MSSLPYNPILIFKQQGTKQGENIDNIGDRDFILGIQTEFQRDVLQLFGPSTCVDTTHVMNNYVQFHFVDDDCTGRIWRRNTCSMDDIK